MVTFVYVCRSCTYFRILGLSFIVIGGTVPDVVTQATHFHLPPDLARPPSKVTVIGHTKVTVLPQGPSHGAIATASQSRPFKAQW